MAARVLAAPARDVHLLLYVRDFAPRLGGLILDSLLKESFRVHVAFQGCLGPNGDLARHHPHRKVNCSPLRVRAPEYSVCDEFAKHPARTRRAPAWPAESCRSLRARANEPPFSHAACTYYRVALWMLAALGADGFIAFILAFVAETAVMVTKRVAMDPLKFRMQRVLKFKLKVQTAQRTKQPVPVSTPETEALGLLTDMISLMYRFSVDTLGIVICPITILVLYMFREPFSISKLYGMRSTDLIFFMLFSFFMIPALWIVDIFLFNLLELLWNWKLFDYMQFCHERFSNRSRRWIGLAPGNEGLPPDLRAFDQMCLSVQLYLLGSLHASGMVLAVLGYMLILHRTHNVFGDPVVVPTFAAVSVLLGTGKFLLLRVADRFHVWVVEEEVTNDQYGEGPLSQNSSFLLLAGTAAVDSAVAACVDDAYAAGFTNDDLVRLLGEATLFLSPGSSIHVRADTEQYVSNTGDAVPQLRTPVSQVYSQGRLCYLPACAPTKSISRTPDGSPWRNDDIRGRMRTREVAHESSEARVPLSDNTAEGRRADALEGPAAFSEFMAAFRREMHASRICSLHPHDRRDERRVSTPASAFKSMASIVDDGAFSKDSDIDWPEELLLALGVSDEPGAGPVAASSTDAASMATTDSSQEGY